jgi:hypothetical protein
MQLVGQAIDSIYDLNFEAADPLLYTLEKRIPDHPGFSLLKAFYDNWKFRPIKEGTEHFTRFEKNLYETQAISESLLEENENDVEGIFFAMATHAYLAQLYVDNGHSMRALKEAKNAYRYIKKGFDLAEEYPEFYFPSGLYNYYRVKYPEENPFYKPFLWFFKDGDKAEGLNLLEKGAASATFTRAECLTYLCHIYLRYENKPGIAIQYARKLNTMYPNNLNFTALYIENLLWMADYPASVSEIQILRKSDLPLYRYVGEVFYGVYLEKFLIDIKGARDAYLRAKQLGEEENVNVNHYESILNLGLGRINNKMGNTETAKSYFKKSLKLADYAMIKDEAKAYLD